MYNSVPPAVARDSLILALCSGSAWNRDKAGGRLFCIANYATRTTLGTADNGIYDVITPFVLGSRYAHIPSGNLGNGIQCVTSAALLPISYVPRVNHFDKLYSKRCSAITTKW